ncbi:MAG: type II secretion system minor pseudopilin GspJ [Steroidobacteraceae bacterium]
MKRSSGFTLIELLVAVLITAILVTLGYSALEQALRNRETVQANAARLAAVQGAMRAFLQDFGQLAPRPVREPLGAGYQPALLADAHHAVLTRGGFANPAGVQRTTLQRVRYVLEEGTLYREQWPVLDALLDPPPQRRALIDGVKTFSLRFLNDGRNWQDTWPPAVLQATPGDRELRWLPQAVEVTLELEDWGRLIRLVEVAG